MMLSRKRIFSFLALFLSTQVACAWSESTDVGHLVFQLGGYWSQPGTQQHVEIQDLIGDEFTVNNGGKINALLGLGYYFSAPGTDYFDMAYGINAFYLAKNTVQGDVIQENLYTNLSYQYNVSHYPIYAVAKSMWNTNSTDVQITADLGAGIDFMQVSSFSEQSLDGGITIPDNIYSTKTNPVFSFTLGAGVEFNHVFGDSPLECGYRLFYLNQGNLNITNSQVLTALETGNILAHSVVCAVTF